MVCSCGAVLGEKWPANRCIHFLIGPGRPLFDRVAMPRRVYLSSRELFVRVSTSHAVFFFLHLFRIRLALTSQSLFFSSFTRSHALVTFCACAQCSKAKEKPRAPLCLILYEQPQLPIQRIKDDNDDDTANQHKFQQNLFTFLHSIVVNGTAKAHKWRACQTEGVCVCACGCDGGW